MVLLLLIGGECQLAPSVPTEQLLRHHAGIEMEGLGQTQAVAPVKATAAAPQSWRMMPLQSKFLYKHQHWLSPTKATGAGVAYIHMPFPLSAQALVWFVKGEYSKRGEDGKILSEWTDSLGRAWFEAENSKYHLRGYAVTNGFDAWIVYGGYKTNRPINEGEIELAARCAESVMPGVTTLGISR